MHSQTYARVKLVQPYAETSSNIEIPQKTKIDGYHMRKANKDQLMELVHL